MAIYDRTTKVLMGEFAQQMLKPGQVFDKREAVAWFAKHYPKIKSNTVALHVDGMSVNSANRKHHPHIRAGTGWDVFFKLPNGQFRLWDEKNDPAPIYRDQIIAAEKDTTGLIEDAEADENGSSSLDGSNRFAYEQHLQDYLVKNLVSLEPGLRLYEEEGFTGAEFPVGGRYIDVLAVDPNGDFVVIELKVSRGYDRTIGQILRYMGWVQQNIAGDKRVRGIIVASEITEDLKLAASRLSDIKLVEYEISFRLKPVESGKAPKGMQSAATA
jgi:endonuclease